MITAGKKQKQKLPPVDWPPLTESELYALVRCDGRLDPNYPATKRLMAVLSEIREAYIRAPGRTMADIEELGRRVEENRRQRQLLFAGRVRPVVEWERQKRWIEEFGLSPVIGYELDDPC